MPPRRDRLDNRGDVLGITANQRNQTEYQDHYRADGQALQARAHQEIQHGAPFLMSNGMNPAEEADSCTVVLSHRPTHLASFASETVVHGSTISSHAVARNGYPAVSASNDA